MPAYYRFGKGFHSYLKLADELWYAAGGITPLTKSTLNVAIGILDRPPVSAHDQFIYAMQQERHYEAAMLYEALIYVTEEAIYIDHQISKNFRGKSSARVLWHLVDATKKAYDMVVYSVYPPSRAGFGASKDWYALHQPRKSKILHPTEITKKSIEDMRHRLWGIVMQTHPWGTRGYQGASPEIPTVKARMKNLINEAISSADDAEKSARRGVFVDAAVSFTHAVFMLDLYFRYRQSLSGKMSAPEFDEIDVETENIFMSHYKNLKDAIGL